MSRWEMAYLQAAWDVLREPHGWVMVAWFLMTVLVIAVLQR